MSAIALLRSATRSSSRRSGDPAPDDGFTLLEVVVGFTLLVIVASGLVAALINGAKATGISQQRAAAANIARQYIEAARVPNQGLTITSMATPITVPGTIYSVCRSVSPVTSSTATLTGNGCGSTTSGCTQSTTAGLSYYVTVVVTWASNSSSTGTRSLYSNTVMAC